MTIKEAITAFDVNRDGTLNRSEFERMIKRINLDLKEDEIDALMDEFDLNGNGEISLSEFAWRIQAAKLQDTLDDMNAHIEKQKVALYDIFLNADANRDGVLNIHEFQSIFQAIRMPLGMAKIQQLFSLFDTDCSGLVSYREFLQKCGYRATERTFVRKEKLTLSGPNWQMSVLGAIKSSLLKLKMPAHEFLAQYDVNDSNTLTASNLRRALWALGFEVSQMEADKVFDLFDCSTFTNEGEKQRRGLGPSGGRGRAQGRTMQKSVVRRIEIEVVLQRLRQSTESAVDKEVDNWKKAKEIVQRVHNELNAQKLSVMKLLADLDPLKIKKESFHNFLKTLSRHLQSIPMEELKKMHDVVAVDSHGMALVDELARLILENRGPTEGLPPAESRPGIKARREGEELRFRKQADGL